MNISKALTLLALGVATLYACTQFEDIGSDLVNDDELQIDTDTDLDYTLTTYVRDSLIAYSRKGEESDFVPTTHILGQVQDPMFGTIRYDLTAQMQFSPLGVDFSGATFDSAFLLLSYDTTFVPYGEVPGLQTLDVFELASRDLPDEVYITDQFETKPELIGSLTFEPSFKNQNRGDSLTAPSHIRVPMAAEFGERILDLDTSVTSSVLNFLDEFPGFVIRPRPQAFQGAYRFFAYPSQTSGQAANTEVANYSGVRIFYTKDGEAKEAYLVMRAVLHHFTTVDRQTEGSVLEQVLQNQDDQPEYLFIQPTHVGVRMDFHDLHQYRGKVINNVALKWTVANHPMDDTSGYRPMDAVFALQTDQSASHIPISDILFYQSGGAYRQYFGGILQRDTTSANNPRFYSFNITNHFQRMVNGTSEPYLYIVPTPQDVSRIARSVIHGPGSTQIDLQPRISITYSSTNN